jgi:WD40 repeat protein
LRDLDPKEESIRLHDVTRKILQEQRAETVSASDDRTLRVWDLETGEPLAVMTLDAKVLAVAATFDGKIVVAGDQPGKVHFFDLVTPD